MKPIVVVQGGQFGSEAKGAVAGALALKGSFIAAVRTGAINAGHTVYYNGKPYKMQQLPVAWVDPGVMLVIGPGAYIHIPTLLREIEQINTAMPEAKVQQRILIDHRCHLHTESDHYNAISANRHKLIGATGKGCAEAIISKIKDRGVVNPSVRLASKDERLKRLVSFGDVPEYLSTVYKGGGRIMVEGTQGSLLDMHQGEYPFTTSRMTTAANWVAESGLPITAEYELVIVMRTFPIRVAGNSGPLFAETTWPFMMRSINQKLSHWGLPERVDNAAIDLYEEEVQLVAPPAFKPYCLAPHLLSVAQRVEFMQDLSVCYSSALNNIWTKDPAAYANLIRVMEVTTVTNKPRRIGAFDFNNARRVVRHEAPTSVVLTFLNYVFPEAWGATNMGELLKYGSGPGNYTRDMEASLGCKVSAVTTGPLPEHFIGKLTE